MTAEAAGDLMAGGFAPAVRRRRPRDRKQQIRQVAAARFWTLGYHPVGMSEIAAEVGIATSALYRHYRSKHELLIDVLNEALDRVDGPPAELAGDVADDFHTWVGVVAHAALDRREFAALWSRESGHLPEANQLALKQRQRIVLAKTRAAVADRTPSEPRWEQDLKSRAVLAVLESPSYHHVSLDDGPFLDTMTAVATAVADADLPESKGGPSSLGEGRDPQEPASRRERLLGAAARQFAGRGYAAVSLGDIGAAAGITGPSVYTYFVHKHDLLVAALNRGTESLWLDLHHALAGADGPLDALHRTVASYVRFAVINPDVVSVMLTESVHLPPVQREHIRASQHDYLAEWVSLLCHARPELSAPQARILVHAAAALANLLVGSPALRGRPDLVAEITGLAKAVLATDLGA